MPTDPFLDDNDGSDNSNDGIRELREHISKLERDLKDRDKELGKTRTQLAESQTKHRVTEAKGFGLTESQAQAFLSLNPEADVTKEAVEGFATNLGLTLASSEPAPPPAAETESSEPELPEFRPASGNEPVTRKMPWPEYRKILISDPNEAERLALAGLVEGIDPD